MLALYSHSAYCELQSQKRQTSSGRCDGTRDTETPKLWKSQPLRMHRGVLAFEESSISLNDGSGDAVLGDAVRGGGDEAAAGSERQPSRSSAASTVTRVAH